MTSSVGRHISPSSSTGNEPFTCELCLAEMPSLPLLHTHKLVHFNTRYVCYACDLYFERPSNTVLHINARHRDCTLTPKLSDATCAFCLVRCSTARALERHRVIHAMDDVNRCVTICIMVYHCHIDGTYRIDHTYAYTHTYTHTYTRTHPTRACAYTYPRIHTHTFLHTRTHKHTPHTVIYACDNI